MIVYIMKMRIGTPTRHQVFVERHTTIPNPRWRRWLRLRERVAVEVLGAFYAPGMRFELTRSSNRPSTLSVHVDGRDALSMLRSAGVEA